VSKSVRRAILLAGILLVAALVPIRAQMGKNKITYQDFDWQVYKSPHFDIHYYPEMEIFLEEIVSHAESAYLTISRELDHELRFRVPLVVYRTHAEFEQTNITLSEIPEGVGAFAEPVQNRMVLPIDMPAEKLYQLIAHELTHIFEYSIFYDGYLGRALRSNPPTWLMEGLASYLAKDEDNLDRMAIRDAVVNNIIPPIQALNRVTFLTYRFGHAIFDYIAEEHGEEGLRSFLFEYRKVLLTNNLDKAVKEAFGYDVDAFNRRFNRYLRKKYVPVLMEKKSPDDYGTEIGIRGGAFTFSPTISPSGELVAALSSPKMELDLVIIAAEEGTKVKNLTKGFTNQYRNLVTEAFSGKRDLSWSPTADEVAVFARKGNRWPLLIYNAVNKKKLAEIAFDDIVQCSSPAFSPDGKRVAFEGNRDGVVDLFEVDLETKVVEVDLETKVVRNLTQDDFYDANPWYAADGKALLYNRRIGSYWKIFSVDLADPTKKTQVTTGPSSDIQPSYSRDGNSIFFSSDRDENGVFNLYSLDLATGDIDQITDVVGGCFAPVEMAERGDDRNLVFTSFFEGTFRLYRMPLLEPERTIRADETLADPVEAEPFEPPLTLRVDEDQKSPYKLKWDIEAPYISVGVTNDGTFLTNAAVQFADLMGNHRIHIIASTVSDFANFNVIYQNRKRRFTWGGEVFDYRDFFVRATSSGSIARDEIYRYTGLNAFIDYPISRYYRVEGTVGVFENAQDVLNPGNPTDPTGIPNFVGVEDRFLTVSAAIVGDTTRYQSFGPYQGKRFRLRAIHASHLSGDFPGDQTELRLDFRAYRKATRRSLFAARVSSIYNLGERENSYGFGGINQLRGYDYREFFGSRIVWANLEFRFPLVDSLRFPVLNLGQIRGVFFFDVGAAWLADDMWYNPDTQRIRVDSGGDAVPFSFWNSDAGRLQDGRASYGAGFNFLFLGGLQFNWMWAKRLNYQEYNRVTDEFQKKDGGSTRMDRIRQGRPHRGLP